MGVAVAARRRARRALAGLLFLFAAISAPALTLVYTEWSAGGTTRHTIVIEPASGGFTVEVSTEREGRVVVVQELETDPGLSVVRWHWIEADEATDVTAVRDGSTISLAGLRRGAKIARRFTVGADPWYQLFPLGLETFALGARGSVKFWAIGTSGIAAMRIGSLRAVAAGPGQIEWNGTRVAAIRVRVSLSGPVSILWHGDYWFRSSDGRHIVTSGDRGPGTTDGKFELTGER